MAHTIPSPLTWITPRRAEEECPTVCQRPPLEWLAAQLVAQEQPLAGKHEPCVRAHPAAHSLRPSPSKDGPWPLSAGKTLNCPELVCLQAKVGPCHGLMALATSTPALLLGKAHPKNRSAATQKAYGFERAGTQLPNKVRAWTERLLHTHLQTWCCTSSWDSKKASASHSASPGFDNMAFVNLPF